MTKRIVLATALVAAVVLGCVAMAADEVVIRCGITVSEDSSPAKALRVFQNYIGEKSNGRIKLELHLNGTLGNERDMIEGLGLGTQEMVNVSTAPLLNFSPDFMVWDLPYMVENSPEGLRKTYKIMDGPVGQAMLKSLEKQGIKGLSFAHNGFRHCVNRVKPVAHPADIRGLKIRTMENNVHLAFYSAVGASPTPMASTEAFTALQQGVIDGMDNNLDSFYTQGAFETAKYLTLTSHVFSASAMLMSLDFYNSLSADDQQIILDGIEVTKKAYRQISEERDGEVADIIREKYGVTVTPIDFKEWQPLVKGIWDQYGSSITPEYLEAFTK